ncbi:MAG: YvrJ family protein [Thermovirgaceae bacterium]|nr:YvrJ family protein [Synergistota bacterium]NLO56531.1 YvrJ family protein [Thermovirga sp.]
MEDFVASAIQSGFAVAVAAYLLVRMESRLEELTQAIRELHVAIVNRGGV